MTENHSCVLLACRAAWCMHTCIRNMDQEGLFMSTPAASETSFMGGCFVQAFVWLAHSAFVDRKSLYRLRPKLHLWDHEMKRLAVWKLNPKAVSCFSDEDFIGRVCNIATSCSHQGVLHDCVRRYLVATYSSWKLRL